MTPTLEPPQRQEAFSARSIWMKIPIKLALTHLGWISLLGLLEGVLFGTLLFSMERVVSDKSADLAFQFFYSRGFGFAELTGGNLPLWNPYVYGGVPFLADFQSALLYPFNIIFLFLPLTAALNCSFALHGFILGAGMYAWAIHRGLRPPAAFLSGVAAMLGGTFFLQIQAGHLSNVCSMAWAPFIFLGIDGWLASRRVRWILCSAGSAALQVYAGHPQYVYYTALVAGCYSAVHLIGARRLSSAGIGLLAIYPLAALLSAAQLFPGISAASESVRSGSVSYDFAAMFSFPPENFLTVFAPWFFGDMQTVPYWGRCYLWEMSLFVGASTLLLALHGIISIRDKVQRLRFLVLFAGIIILALGAHTPLHQLLYHALPVFGSFRGSSKFIFFAGLFLALFAGMGLNSLFDRTKSSPLAGLAGIVCGALLVASGFWLSGSEHLFRNFVSLAANSGESYLNLGAPHNDGPLLTFLQLGIISLKVAGGLMFVAGSLLVASRRWQSAAWMLAILACGELFLFARSSMKDFKADDLAYSPVAKFLNQHPGENRIVNLFNPDASMLLGVENIWGYDPSVLKRYAQLLHVTQGRDPEKATQYLEFTKQHAVLKLLRTGWIFKPKQDGNLDIVPLSEPSPRFFMVQDYRVIKDHKALLEALEKPDFDLKRSVLLEEEPIPAPEKESARYKINVIESSTDHWVFDISTDRATLLVVTDSYSKDWSAVALHGSDQTNYQLLPADYALRVIPLAAGHHLLKMEYVPAGFDVGIKLTLLTLAAIGVGAGVPIVRRRISRFLDQALDREESFDFGLATRK